MFKAMVKEMAAAEGLLATFIGKPWNDDEGSGFHLHFSLVDGDGVNLLADENGPDGLSELARQFLAGVLEHGQALMAFLNPTTNAYRRITEMAQVPTLVSWGHDNRLCMVRVPRERGAATRLEVRVADGASNPYLATAAVLMAGLDGIDRKLEPPPPLEGLIYEQPGVENCPPLPRSFDAAIAHLAEDAYLNEAMGEDLVRVFLEIKGAELARANAYTTDWEFNEYTHHL